MATFEAKSYEEIVDSLLVAMTTSPSPLTDRSVGSVTRTLTEAVGWEIAYLHKQLVKAYLWGFVDTAEGDALDRVVAVLGVTRSRPDTAVGQVVFKRRDGVSGEIVIPAGTRLSASEPPVAFETTEDLTLEAADRSGAVAVRALAAGAEGVVPPKAIHIINRPLAGISEVENPDGTALGGAVETDQQLRDRARRALERAGKATVNAIRYGLMEVPGVRGVSVMDDPVAEPGLVRVIVDCPASVRPRALAALDDLRPAGVRVIHNLDGDAADAVKPVKLAIKLYVTPDREGIPSEDRRELDRQIEAAVRGHVGGLKLGDALSGNRLVALAMAVPGVGNVEVAITAAPDRRPEPDGRLLAAPDEKFELESVQLLPGRTTAYLDVRVRALALPGLGLTAAQVEDAVRRSLEQWLEQLRSEHRAKPYRLTVE
ncbi:MAG TPA: baseplate J/gp47 family protein, partial [Symbiobacteriaceae bacterium]|nr:baseplate J/gp47 family protein [Symbiobacteriaceae bacterium]